MEKYFNKYSRRGLPNGANEQESFAQGFIVSERGQWDFPGQPTMIPNANGRITMQGVYDTLLGIDDQGNSMIMKPGGEYQFPGNHVFEIPLPKAQMGGIGQQASNQRKGDVYPFLSYRAGDPYPTAGVKYIKGFPTRDTGLQHSFGTGIYGSPEKTGADLIYSSIYGEPNKPFNTLFDAYGGYGTDQGFYTGVGVYPMFNIVDRKDASFSVGPYLGYEMQTKLPKGIVNAMQSTGDAYFADPQSLPLDQTLPLSSRFIYGAGAKWRGPKGFNVKTKFWLDPVQGKLSDPDSDNPIIKTYQEKVGTDQLHFKPGFEISAGYNIPIDAGKSKIKKQIEERKAREELEKELKEIRNTKIENKDSEIDFVRDIDLKKKMLNLENRRYRFQDGGATTPEEWEQEIRAVESQIGNPSGWTLQDYNLLQNKLNDYRSWRENTPEGQAVIDSHNVEGEYNIPLPEHLQNYTNAMMKARLAYANEFGNPAAQRIIVAPDQPYDFGDGYTGTHYMSSINNYAVPQIQDENGQLVLGDYGPESNEAIRFDNPDDAQYFAEHYKEVSPGFMELELTDDEIEQYVKGGYVVEELPKAQVGIIDPSKMKRRTSLLDKYDIDPALTLPKSEVAESTKPKNYTPSKSSAANAVKETKQVRDAGAQMIMENPSLSDEQKYEMVTSPQKSIDYYNTVSTAAENQGTIKKKVEQSDYHRFYDYAVHPADAFWYYMRGESFPENYREMRLAGIDPIAEYENPFKPSGGNNAVFRAVDAMINPTGAFDSAYRNISEGNLAGAALDIATIAPFMKALRLEKDAARLFKGKPKTPASKAVKSKPSQWDNEYIPPSEMGYNPFSRFKASSSNVSDEVVNAYNKAVDLKKQGKINVNLPDTPEGFDVWLKSQYNQKPIYRVVDVSTDLDPVIKQDMLARGLNPANEYDIANYMGTTVAPKNIINRGRRSGGHDELIAGTNKDILYYAEDPRWIGPRYGGSNPYYVKTYKDLLPKGLNNQVLGLRDASRMRKNYSRNFPNFNMNNVPSGVLFEDNALRVGSNLITPIVGDKGSKVRDAVHILKGSDFERLPNKFFNKGGSIDVELTPEEIQWYTDNGYVVEEI
jgi:hypothetical protein